MPASSATWFFRNAVRRPTSSSSPWRISLGRSMKSLMRRDIYRDPARMTIARLGSPRVDGRRPLGLHSAARRIDGPLDVGCEHGALVTPDFLPLGRKHDGGRHRVD